jgi:radical SAM superfamily enzyme YgiQ (UPF0313 family)
MKIALLFPAWTGGYGLFGYFNRKGSILPPMNLALIAAIAVQYGHEVIIIDGEAERLTQSELIEQALAFKPDIIGLTASSPFFHLTKALAVGIKKVSPYSTIVVGGAHITITREQSLSPCFDYLFVGEAEKSFPAFLQAYSNGGGFAAVPGLIYRRDGEIVSTGSSSPVDRCGLDRLPFPARHLLDMPKYTIGTMKGRLNFATIQSIRGCPFKCIFCKSDDLNSTLIRYRSPQSVIDEIREVVRRYNVHHFFILDDVLTLWRKRTIELCDLIDQSGLKITFEGSTRANLVDDELISRLSHSGLIRLSFGLETVDLEMRKTMGKQVPMEAYVTANRLCNKYGIEALNSVMIGLPGETRETVGATLNFLRHSRDVKQANFAIAIPYPGTEFHRMAVAGEYGVKLTTSDFSKYKRYGSAVTSVGSLSSQDLVDIQNEGFVSIYSAPWRWLPMVRKMGVVGALLTVLRIAKIVSRRLRHRT